MLKIAYDAIYCHPLPEGHRFPMAKYELIPAQLLHEGTVTADNFFSPRATYQVETLKKYVLQVHTATYLNDLLTLQLPAPAIRRIGFPLSAELVERELLIAEGTIQCCHYASEFGISMNVAGGTHHAYPSHGEGFCLLNDVAIAASYILHNGLSTKVLVVDLDVHQGNGTAAIFKEDKRVITFSMHGEANYPLRKEVSDLDIALPTGTTDEGYLNILTHSLHELITQHQPDFIFYISGVDVLATDKLGKLNLSRQGCQRRDKLVLEAAYSREIPLVITMGGGYSVRLADIVEAHAATFRLAQQLMSG